MQGIKYQVLPNSGICCKELAGLKVTSFAHACAVSALSHRVLYTSVVGTSSLKTSSFNESRSVDISSGLSYIFELFRFCTMVGGGMAGLLRFLRAGIGDVVLAEYGEVMSENLLSENLGETASFEGTAGVFLSRLCRMP